MIVAKRLETTNGIGPEAELFTFSKMAAGMYLEHYLDSKMDIFVGGNVRGFFLFIFLPASIELLSPIK